MTAKDFFKGAFYLPATAFSGITNLVLGSYKRDTRGNIIPAPEKEKGVVSNTNNGILGTILDAVKYVARATSNFIHNHKTAIATAFWASLALAGAAALTVFLWPAALAAVTTFAIAGISIAAVVGTGLAAQVGAVATLTAIATSAAVYAAATVVNTITAIKDWAVARRDAKLLEEKQNQFTPESTTTSSSEDNSSNATMRTKLTVVPPTDEQANISTPTPMPVHFNSPLASPTLTKKQQDVTDNVVLDNTVKM